MSSRLRLVLVLMGAFAFGLLAAWLKGPNTNGVSAASQLRSDLGNISTPWLLVAFIPGTMAMRSRTGALLGFVSTIAALLGFYLLTSLLVDLGAHGTARNFGMDLYANRVYLISGALSGPVFGALGSWWHRTRSLGTTVVAGLLLIGEPIVLAAIGLLVPATVVGRNGISLGVYAAELALGLVLLLVARTRGSAIVNRST